MALTVERSELEGNCPFCGGYRAHKRLVCGDRVAHLEGEKAALAAALREALEYLETMGLSLKIQDSIRAALSDTQTGTAGGGWLPPEAIREFVERVNRRAEAEMQRRGTLEGAHHRALGVELDRILKGDD